MTYKNCGDIPPQLDVCDPITAPASDLCNVETSESYVSRSSDRRVHGMDATTIFSEEDIELIFYVRNTMDECVARMRVEDPNIGLPANYNGQPLREYRLNVIGWNVWECRALYGYRGASATASQIAVAPASQVLPTAISYSTGGGRTKLTQSYRTMNHWPVDSTSEAENLNNRENAAPSFDRAILWNGTNVEGLDVVASNVRYTETWIMNANLLFSQPTTIGRTERTVFPNMMALWSNYTGGVHLYRSLSGDPNEPVDPDSPQEIADTGGQFRGWTDGEVLFVGAQVRQIGSIHYEVTYEFEVSPNKTFSLPPTIDKRTPREGVFAYGHDYVWYLYGQTDKTAGQDGVDDYQMAAPLPKFAYVEQVYKDRTFANLQVGTAAFNPAVVNLIGCTCGDAELVPPTSMPGHPEDYCEP